MFFAFCINEMCIRDSSIENAWAHIDELKPPRAQKALREHYELAQFSKWLATIRLDVPVELALPDMKLGNLYTPEAYEEIKRLEFRSMLKLSLIHI